MSQLISLDLIQDNPWQVREVYDPAYLEDLAADIARNGLLQKPLARQVNGHYQLAFGHCRIRALRLLLQQGQTSLNVPLEVQRLTDEQMADFAWTENEKRRDVTPIERMHAIKKQMETFGWTQAQVAERRGLSESTVSNILRLGQLPEDVQAQVHGGQLSERAALPLITYFNLPETVRKAAAKKAYIPDPVQYAEQGKSSDDIRQAVNSVVQNVAISLKDIPLTQAFEGEAIITATCQGCANLLTYNQHPYCGEQTRNCYNAKTAHVEAQRCEQASVETGIAFKAHEESITQNFMFKSEVPALAFAREHQCEHLRLQQSSYYIQAEETLDAQRYPRIRLVCCNPDGKCACKEAARIATQEAYTPSPEQLVRQKAEREEAARRDALVNTFNTHLSLPTQAAFLTLLTANDVLAWRLLLNKISNAGWDAIKPLSLEECLTQLADEVIDPGTWLITHDTDTAVVRLNLKRTRLGLEPLELPEPENMTPAEKLLRRLERIESWMERCSEGETEPTLEAVRGNLANLDQLDRELTSLMVDDLNEIQLSDFVARRDTMINALEAWLVEAEAESDEESTFEEDEEAAFEEDEEEDLEEEFA